LTKPAPTCPPLRFPSPYQNRGEDGFRRGDEVGNRQKRGMKTEGERRQSQQVRKNLTAKKKHSL